MCVCGHTHTHTHTHTHRMCVCEREREGEVREVGASEHSGVSTWPHGPWLTGSKHVVLRGSRSTADGFQKESGLANMTPNAFQGICAGVLAVCRVDICC